MRVAAYFRTNRNCATVKSQQELINNWYWGDPSRWEWVAQVHDKGSHQRIHERPNLQKLVDKLESGDLLVFAWFGILCNTLEDATEGLPPIWGRGIRTFSVGDDREFVLEDMRLFRIIQREWYLQPSRSRTPPLAGQTRRPNSDRIPRRGELRFMQWCWKQSVEKGRQARDIARDSQEQWPVHPRNEKKPATMAQVDNAINAYHSILIGLHLGRKSPAWLNWARREGFFNETLSESIDLRFDHFVKSV